MESPPDVGHRRGWARVVVTRGLGAVATLLLVSIIVFGATEALPGDVATAVLGKDATPAAVKVVNERLHLDQPLLQRYEEWLRGILEGRPGDSLAASTAEATMTTNQNIPGVPVTDIVSRPFWRTLLLTGLTTLLLIPLSLLFGILAAVRQDGVIDRVITTTALATISLPEFVVATMLVLALAVHWHLFPAISLLDTRHSIVGQWNLLVLPVVTLLAGILAQTIRMVRASVLTVLDSDYVRMARLSGLPAGIVFYRYVIWNAMGPIVQVFAINIAYMMGGVVIVETLFQYNGLGLAFVNAVHTRDVPVIQVIALFIAFVYIMINILADITSIALSPRLRTRRQ